MFPLMYDAGKDGFIDLMELKLMMEKLGAPQTHLGLKNMIKEVDEDLDSKLSFREFLLIFRKAAAGELQEDSGLHALARLSEIDVSTEGVKGAKNFFEAKVMMSIHRVVMHEGCLVPARWEQRHEVRRPYSCGAWGEQVWGLHPGSWGQLGCLQS
uniref:EF-hand domain family member D2 n=2 Tax=Amazona collaria TaxID=241587 RepID=A0A8B9G4V0_9PSIT